MEEKFDIIVVGTGLIESILAAALARVGQKVLHVDQNNHYGSDWTTLTPREFSEWHSNRTAETFSTKGVQPHAPFACSSSWTYRDEDRYLKLISTGEDISM